MTTDEYCRQIEAYLCRKNDGHLIRLVGPSFERVRGWAEQGIPFRIACQGIDAYFVRYYAKGTRRRPVQIDFCEHDVMEGFDAWRRAVGVRTPVEGLERQPSHDAPRKKSLRGHLDRVCERITNRRASMTPPPPAFDAALERIVIEAAAFRDAPGQLRGHSREQVVARLAELDRLMLDAARGSLNAATLSDVRAEAADQLQSFRGRMPEETYRRALEAAVDRILRDREKLPHVSFE